MPTRKHGFEANPSKQQHAAHEHIRWPSWNRRVREEPRKQKTRSRTQGLARSRAQIMERRKKTVGKLKPIGSGGEPSGASETDRERLQVGVRQVKCLLPLVWEVLFVGSLTRGAAVQRVSKRGGRISKSRSFYVSGAGEVPRPSVRSAIK